MRSDRRRFLRELSFLGGALSLPGATWLAGCKPQPSFLDADEDSPAFTEQRAPHYFVFYYLMGGWDITLTTDPLHDGGRIDVDYLPIEIFERGGHRFGPSLAPLKPFMSQMAIVRGLKAQALNHPQARFQLVTGHFKSPGERPRESIQTILASHIGRDYPLPNISSDTIRPATFLGELDGHLKPMRISEIDQLRGLVTPRGSVKDYQDQVRETLRKRDARFVERHERSALARDYRSFAELARELGESDYAARAARIQKPTFNETSMVKHKNKWGKQAHLAVEVIKQDLSPIITIGSGEFDAHQAVDYRGHRRAVERSLETVAAVCEGLAAHRCADGASLLERTTVVVTSEFSRQPWINELGGKHHWDANAVLFIGKGVRATPNGVTVFGESDDGLYPQPINPSNGASDRKADDLLNGHYLATILAMAGVDPGRYFDEDPILPVIA